LQAQGLTWLAASGVIDPVAPDLIPAIVGVKKLQEATAIVVPPQTSCLIQSGNARARWNLYLGDVAI
jgi:hypothetical protein